MTAGAAVDLVLFDFGGTLFHPAPAERLVARAAGQLGLTLDADQLVVVGQAFEAAGIPGGRIPPIPPELQAAYDARDLGIEQHRACWVTLLARAEVPPDAGVPNVEEMAVAIYEQTLLPDGFVPYADAAATLAALADRDVRVGLISNIGFDLREILHAHGFGALADTATLSYEVGVMKPDPKIFRAALKTFASEPQSAVMVGDSEEADGGAADLGITTLILPITPAGSVHGLGEVLRLLDGLAA